MTEAFTATELAKALRIVQEAREASWDDEARVYRRTYSDCEAEYCQGNEPLRIILSCLLTAGYCDIWDFCDLVLDKP